MTEHDPDQELRGAFDRLRGDAAKVNTMAAMQQHDSNKAKTPWYTSPGMLVGSLAAVALLVVGAVFVLGGNDPTENDSAVDTATPSPEPGQPTPPPGQGAFPFAGDWILVTGIANGEEFWTGVEAQGQATLNIESGELGGQMGGSAFCNSYGGAVSMADAGDGIWGAATDGGTLFTNISQTEMGCEEPLMSLEGVYLNALLSVDSAMLGDPGQMELHGDGISLTFERRDETPNSDFVGTTWQLDTIVQGEVAGSTINGADPALLLFNDDSTFTGSTGCRTIAGEWTRAGADVVLTSWGAEGECPAEFQGQDSSVISILESNFTAEVEGERLILLTASGDGLVYRATAGEASTAPTPSPVENTAVEGEWILETAIIEGVAVEPNSFSDILLSFSAGQFLGNDTCNDFGGEYFVSGQDIELSNLAGTEVGCEFSAQYQAALTLVDTADREVDMLLLSNNASAVTQLVYRTYTAPTSPTPTPEPVPVIPAATTFDDLACGAAESVPSTVDATSSVNQVSDITVYEADGCRRTVFTMISTEGGPDSLSMSDLTITEATGNGIDITTSFPLTNDFEVDAEDRTAGLAAKAQTQEGVFYLHVNQGSNETVMVLNDPTRIVVDSFTTPTDLQPVFGNNVILPRPLNEGGPGRTLPIPIEGHARPFEAQGSVQLRTAPGPGEAPGSGELVTAQWSGGNLPQGDEPMSRYGFRAAWEAWGSFSFTLEDVPPGDYELVFINDAAGEDAEGFIALAERFTVLDDGSSPVETEYQLNMEIQGLVLVPLTPGVAQTFDFGTTPGDMIAAIEEQLNDTATSQDLPECPFGPATSYSFAATQLTLTFQDDQFVGWSTNEPGLRTEFGTGPGATLAEVQTDHPVTQLVDSTLGEEWFEEGSTPGQIRTFFLDAPGPDGVVTLMQGGANCNFR